MTQTRKPRRKATTDLGKSIMQRERQRLVREQAALAEKLAADAIASRKLATVKADNPVRDADRAIQRSIVRRVAGVLASEGVNASIDVESISARYPINAWTDFRHIHVGYHIHDDVRLTAAVLRGLFYHEGGHIRFTVPFPTLTAMAKEAGHDLLTPDGINAQKLHHAWNALEDQRMETAVVSDSPRKAGYFVPMVLSELALTVNSAAANWPLMVWRRYLPSKVVAGARKLFVIQNGEHGEEYAQQIERIVDTYVQSTDAVTMYDAVVDMALMLQAITPLEYNLNSAGHQNMRNAQREVDPDALQIPIDPSMIPEPCEDEEEGEDNPDAFDPHHLLEVIIAAWNAPETLLNIQYVINTGEEADPGESKGGLPGTPPPPPQSDADEDDEDDEEEDEPSKDAEPSKGADKPSKSDDEEEDAVEDEYDDGAEDGDDEDGTKGDDEDDDQGGDDESDDTEADDSADEGGSTGTHTDDGADNEDDPEDDTDDSYASNDEDYDDDELTDEDLQDVLAEAEEERMSDPTLDQDVKSFTDSKQDEASKLDIYTGGRSSDLLAIAEASNLADEMQRAFEAATVDMAPAWHEQQRRGILNVMRYQTRQPGDVEFFKGFVDNGNPGCDIAVSLLLDYSGSMGSVMDELAKVAYASKAACDRLDVPCTVVLWDTEARTLWDANERAEYLPIIEDAGGTNPAIALADLDNQKYGKSKHIVLIMTDDEWAAEAPTLAAFRQDGRTIIGLGYNTGWADSEVSIAESMRRKGADAAYSIQSLDQIPRYLEQTLTAMA